MANYIYARVSTGGQTFEQQMQTITEHFRKMGSDIANADMIITEHVSGAVEWRQRKLRRLVEKCNDGDTIFVSELSRLGRDQADIFSLVDYATKKKGLNLFICKDNIMLENKTQGGKMMLFFYSMQAESERINTCERNLARSAWEREQIATQGGFISKNGKWVTKQGRPKITKEERDAGVCGDNSAAVQALIDGAIQWLDKSEAVAIARRKRAEGLTLQQIVDELNCMFDDYAQRHPDEPNIYATRNGCKPSRGTISKWLNASNPLLTG